MNEVFLIGKIIQDIEYKFMLEKNWTARAKLRLELLDKTRVDLIAYNEIADLCFRSFSRGNTVMIYGKINENELKINDIEVFHAKGRGFLIS